MPSASAGGFFVRGWVVSRSTRTNGARWGIGVEMVKGALPRPPLLTLAPSWKRG